MLQLGAALLAYSPSAALLWLIVSKRSQLLVISVTSALMWVMSVLVVAFFWSSFPALKTGYVWIVAAGAMTQELVRMLLIRTYRRVECVISRAIAAQRPSTEEAARFALHDSTSAIAAALGFGTMHSVVMYGSVLAGSGGPAAMYADSCSTIPLVVVSGKNGGAQQIRMPSDE